MSESKGFEVTDDSSAAWAMRKLRDVQREIENVKTVSADDIARVQEWEAKQLEKHEREVTHWETLLINYLEAERDKGRKSVDLPTGRVTSRAIAEAWDIDAKEFIGWAHEFAPTLVRSKTTELPETVEVLREHFETSGGKVVVKDTGEIVEGIKVKDPTVTYKVETEK